MITEEQPRKKPKQKRRYVATEKRKAQQANYLKPRSGYHPGQKSGRPKQHAEVVGHNAGEILDTLFGLMRKARLSPGDKTRYMVCEALLDRGFGRAPHTLAAAIQHQPAWTGPPFTSTGEPAFSILEASSGTSTSIRAWARPWWLDRRLP